MKNHYAVEFVVDIASGVHSFEAIVQALKEHSVPVESKKKVTSVNSEVTFLF